ncbi:MAG: ribose 1,5-bisphosphate isomerase, partial [Desulfurococcales archaeon]|nr:ribose 1,5-bisphosphate isomerase [Desulfurococcales archaeon]
MPKFEIPRRVIEIREDIRTMRIRGAGRIARAAAEALAIAAQEFRGSDVNEFIEYINTVGEYVRSARPTAVSLPNAVSYVLTRLQRAKPTSLDEAKDLVIRTAEYFIEYSRKAVKIIGELGAKRLEYGDVVMTHCHSTAAVSVIVTAHKLGKVNKVYVKETRPKLQGLITAKALANAGLDVILIPDSSVRYFMKKVTKVIVGADTVAANGAVINKIGTSLVALVAKEARVRTYVAAETYKFSPRTVIGELVPIEVRDPTEIVSSEWLRNNPGVEVYNPVFDVTPPEY